MVTITIRNVPEDVRNVLAGRAARSGRSLQEYMLREIEELASRPTMDDIVDGARADARRAGTRLDVATVIADVGADRR